jgi:hypothetical protein
MKAQGERRYSSYSFTNSALDGGEWWASRPGRALPPGKGPPGTHCTGGWVGPSAGLNTEVRGKIFLPLPGIEPRSPGRPARSQTLYWLSYPGSALTNYASINLQISILWVVTDDHVHFICTPLNPWCLMIRHYLPRDVTFFMYLGSKENIPIIFIGG